MSSVGSQSSQKKRKNAHGSRRDFTFYKLFSVSLFLEGSISWLCSFELHIWFWCWEMTQLGPCERTMALSEGERKPVLENNFPKRAVQPVGPKM